MAKTFKKEFAADLSDLRLGKYKNNEGRPINPKYIVGYYMNGDISNFNFNSKFYGLEFNENNQPRLNSENIEEENNRIKRLNEEKHTKKTQELGKETLDEQTDTPSKRKLSDIIKKLLDKKREREEGSKSK